MFTAQTAAMFEQRNPQAQIKIVREVGHLVPQEAPDVVGQMIADFIG